MISIIAVGDIFPGDHYFTMGHGLGSVFKRRGISYVFENVRHLLNGADIVFGNIEAPLANSSDRKSLVERNAFRGSPEAALGLSVIGFNIMNIANNHILHHGSRAFWETIESLNKAGIGYLGKKGSGQFFSAPLIKIINGRSIGFLGYSFVPEKRTKTDMLYAYGKIENALNDVRLLSEQSDIVIVSAHWGDEGAAIPSEKIVSYAKKLVDSGAKIILGHHPHVFQPIVTYNDALIIYSLGNFVFDLFWHSSLIESAVVKISVDFNASPKYTIYPVKLDASYTLKELDKCEAERFLGKLKWASSILENPSLFDPRVRDSRRLKMQLRKALFFLSIFFQGDMRLKTRFLLKKIESFL